MPGLTNYHAKYFANELTKRSPSDSVEKLAGVLADAQVDLNPHQVEAALFAFRNPFSRGAILADEVGLGKTIEAGLLLSQRWAERKRKLLVILPANLRKQWNQELADKFHLPSMIMETRSFNEAIRCGNLNPFQQSEIVLCSYQFARSKEPYLRQVAWDLVVIDEAHRLRNVYKTSSRIALAIKNAVSNFPKVLLTATPLQNSLLELYGLVSIIDEFAFGDLKSFRTRFARLGNQADFTELKERLKPICKRTLRRQVLEYVPYTDRHALVQEFVPSPDEQKLYDLVSNYLQSPTLYALPAGQRQLMTLILRKLLASSTYAISGTLDGLARKLEAAASAAEPTITIPEELPDNLEGFNELADEWEEDEDASPGQPGLNPDQLSQLKAELAQLRAFQQLAASIMKNSKGEVLLMALRRGFDAAAKARKKEGGVRFQQKAVIFTESRRTQDYLFRVLEQTEFKGKVMIFNGVNNDAGSKAIYQKWLSVDALEAEDHILFSALDDGGEKLDDSQCRRMFDLSAEAGSAAILSPATRQSLDDLAAAAQAGSLEEMSTRNARWFDAEIEKLEHWAEDRRATLKAELDELDEALKAGRKSARTAPTLPEKLERQREVRKLETRRDEAWRAFDQATRDLDKQKDALLDDIAKRLEQRVEHETLFTIRWRIV